MTSARIHRVLEYAHFKNDFIKLNKNSVLSTLLTKK